MSREDVDPRVRLAAAWSLRVFGRRADAASANLLIKAADSVLEADGEPMREARRGILAAVGEHLPQERRIILLDELFEVARGGTATAAGRACHVLLQMVQSVPDDRIQHYLVFLGEELLAPDTHFVSECAIALRRVVPRAAAIDADWAAGWLVEIVRAGRIQGVNAAAPLLLELKPSLSATQQQRVVDMALAVSQNPSEPFSENRRMAAKRLLESPGAAAPPVAAGPAQNVSRTVATAVPDARLRAALRKMVADEGHRVVGEAAEVSGLLRDCARWHADVLILDPRIAPGNGAALVQQVRALDSGAKVVVIMELMSDGRSTKECLAAGAVGFIPEPVSAMDISRVLGKI